MSEFKHILFIDFETHFSKEYSLRRMSVPEYILSDKFQVHLLAAYDPSWPTPKIVLPDDIPALLADYPVDETVCVAHNALFDLSILSWRYGWVPGRMQDTLGMVRALRSYKKNDLGSVAEQLFGCNTKGNILPKVQGLDVAGIEQAGLWPEYCTYAMNDVRLCAMIFARLIDEFPTEEREIMDLVLRCAVTPVLHADVTLLETHLDGLRKKKQELLNECGYDKAALMSAAQFRMALEHFGVEVEHKTSPTGRRIPAFSKTDPFMTELLAYDRADETVNYRVQTLAMARLAHKSTIEETRCERLLNIAKLPWPDWLGVKKPLMPIPLRFSGAHTHRLSGEWGQNMQNLPRDSSKSKLRTSILAPPGHKIIAADLSQVEARCLACFAGQTDLLDQFRNNEDVYANFGTRLFDRPISKTTTPHERWISKTAVLGLGYGCGVMRFDRMVTTSARQFNIPLEGLFDERIAQKAVDFYRNTYSRIPAMWYRLDRLIEGVLLSDNRTQEVPLGPVTIMSRRIELPNGLFLRYDTTTEEELYGARAVENIIQALARIVLMQSGLHLARQGLRWVLSVHDELVFCVPENDVETAKVIIHNAMTRSPEWMPELPLAVEIGVGTNYGSCR